MNTQYIITMRTASDDGVPDRSHISAYRVEGWSQDYAFLDEKREVITLIPRALVVSVDRIRKDEWFQDNAAQEVGIGLATD